MTKKTKENPPPLEPQEENLRNLEASPTGSLHIRNTGNDLPYITTIQVGSNKADLNLVIDTGSPIVWIPDSSLSDTFTNIFNCSRSKTCNRKDKPLSLDYSGGTVEGHIINDQISFGHLTLPKFDMLLVSGGKDFDPSYLDGILGLSLGSYDHSMPTVLDSLQSEGIIKDRIFSMYLGNGDSDAEIKVPGELIFGGYDSMYAEEEFKFVKVKNDLDDIHWTSEISGIGIGKNEVVSFSTNYPAIFDSGTSILVLPLEIVEKVVEQLISKDLQVSYNDKEGIHWCKCSARDTLDDLTFYFEGNSFVVPASSYVKKEGEKCYLALLAVEEADIKVPIILGDVFLKNFYMLFNADEKTVGLAKVNSALGENQICFSCNSWVNFVLFFSMFLGLCYFVKKSRDVKKGAKNGIIRGRVKEGDNQQFQELGKVVVNDTSEQDMTNIII